MFAGKAALVTGGSFGIGRATAVASAKRGAKIVIAGWIENKDQETITQVKSSGGEGLFVKCDVSNGNEVKSLVEKIFAAFGRLDSAFNNAGIERQMGNTHKCTEENWDKPERHLALHET